MTAFFPFEGPVANR